MTEAVYNGILFRSIAEAEAAHKLTTDGLRWEYEPRTFVSSTGARYTPDFYVTSRRNNGAWIEVKTAGGYISSHIHDVAAIVHEATSQPLVLMVGHYEPDGRRRAYRWETQRFDPPKQAHRPAWIEPPPTRTGPEPYTCYQCDTPMAGPGYCGDCTQLNDVLADIDALTKAYGKHIIRTNGAVHWGQLNHRVNEMLGVPSGQRRTAGIETAERVCQRLLDKCMDVGINVRAVLEPGSDL